MLSMASSGRTLSRTTVSIFSISAMRTCISMAAGVSTFSASCMARLPSASTS